MSGSRPVRRLKLRAAFLNDDADKADELKQPPDWLQNPVDSKPQRRPTARALAALEAQNAQSTT